MSNVVEMSGAVFTRYAPISSRAGLRSNFCYHRIAPKVVAVVDVCIGGRTVTNDAENVVKFLYYRGALLPDDVLIYRDTTGRWDQLCHYDRRFIAFKTVGGRSIKDALDRLGVYIPDLTGETSRGMVGV